MAIDTKNAANTNDCTASARAPGEGSGPAATLSQCLLYREACDRVAPAAAVLSEDDLRPVNIDVRTAVARVLGALPRIMAYRDEAVKLYGFEIANFDQLQLHAYALVHAHAQFLAASAPPEALASLAERATNLRDTMYHDALALALRGLISGGRIADFKTNVGYKSLAFDLLGLANLLRENWNTIASRTGIQRNELEEAELLGHRLMDTAAIREQAPATLAQLQAQRQRNFTLFSRSYGQIRRAISFLRWDHEDVDQICPSLFAKRGRSRRK